MLNLLRNNFGLKTLALGLAVAAWGYFHLAAAPGTTARFDQQLTVPIVVSGLRPGLQARFTEKTAAVTVELPRNGSVIKTDQVQAVLDVSDVVDSGVRNVPVKIVAPELTIRSLAPASVLVFVDQLAERVVPVSFAYADQRAGIVVEDASVTPQTTTIRGVAADVSKVSNVRVRLSMPEHEQQFDAMIRPTPIDPRGAEVAGIEISPNLVRVRAHFITTKTK